MKYKKFRHCSIKAYIDISEINKGIEALQAAINAAQERKRRDVAGDLIVEESEYSKPVLRDNQFKELYTGFLANPNWPRRIQDRFKYISLT